MLGTAAYLAPEQATGVEATARSDIYSLGVVSYQFLSGRLPYEAQTLTELALKQQREAPPLLDHVNPEVTPELAAAVDRALALEPADRYATAEELREALVAGARGVAPATSATRVVAPATSVARRSAAAGRPVDAGPAASAAALEPPGAAACSRGARPAPGSRGVAAASSPRSSWSSR